MRTNILNLLIASVAVVSLTGCGGGGSSAAQTPVAVAPPVTPPPAPTPPPPSSDQTRTEAEKFDAFLKSEMGAQNIPALSALVFKEDKILHTSNFGSSNLAQNVALQADHLFLLASISKVVTATALMQLYDDGEFGLDDNINDYLDFKVNVPKQTKNITFRMLLTHTSGIADGSALDGQYYDNVDSPVKLDDFLKGYLVPGGDFYDANENFHKMTPGSAHHYSNTGTALIGLLVQQISGMDFADYTRKEIFEPLGMTNTSWRLKPITGTIVQPYDFKNGTHTPFEHYTFTDYPNGGLRSTTQDMFKFLQAFVRGGTSNFTEVLKANTIKDMITPQIPNLDDEMGLHLFLMNADNTLWGHNGEEKGAQTIMVFNPDTKVGVIVLTNYRGSKLDNIAERAYKLGLVL